MGKLVRGGRKAEFFGKQRQPTSFSRRGCDTYRSGTVPANCMQAVVDDDEVDILLQVENPFNFLQHRSHGVVEIVAVGALAIDGVNQRLSLVVCLEAEVFPPCPCACICSE